MYQIHYTSKFKKDFTIVSKRKYKLDLLEKTISLLILKNQLPPKYRPHKLSGNYADTWCVHIKPDWLLLYLIDETNAEIWLIGTGTHSDLFR
jgi:mRNA interferase YafQ